MGKVSGLLWKLNRLRAMTLPEIAYRVLEKAKKSMARGAFEGWAHYANPGAAPFLPGLSERLSNTADADWLVDTSTASLAGDYAALGQSWPQRPSNALFPPDLWRLDPVSGNLWPAAGVYCFDIAYRHERRLGDIKYVWELNRLQFLQPLAVQAALHEDERALAAIEDAIVSWYQANPPFRGVAWSSGIELALRAISLLVVSTLCGSRLSAGITEKITAILHAHAFWLDRYPSRFSSANNHLIAEATGEFLIALAMPELPFAARLEAKSRRILAEEAEKQFHPDGVPAEQSPSYGAFSAELLLLCVRVAEAAGQPLPSSILERLSAFAEFIGWLQDGNGLVPGIGDDDEGRVLTVMPHEPSYAASVCATIAKTGEPGFGLKTFPEGGYSVIRERRNGHALQLIFDHGPLGYLSIAAHGHADALSVIVTLDDVPSFVDPGTYLYHSGGAWRDWFRGTRAHNTLSVGGADQSVISGPFNWSRKANAVLEEARGGEDWSLTASHDGYRRRFGVIHRRTLFATAEGFAIRDQLEGDGKRDGEIVFQIAADCDARLEDEGLIIARDRIEIASLAFDAPGDIRLFRGATIVDGGGWLSPRFGVKVPATRIVWRGWVPEAGVTTRIAFAEAS